MPPASELPSMQLEILTRGASTACCMLRAAFANFADRGKMGM